MGLVVTVLVSDFFLEERSFWFRSKWSQGADGFAMMIITENLQTRIVVLVCGNQQWYLSKGNLPPFGGNLAVYNLSQEFEECIYTSQVMSEFFSHLSWQWMYFIRWACAKAYPMDTDWKLPRQSATNWTMAFMNGRNKNFLQLNLAHTLLRPNFLVCIRTTEFGHAWIFFDTLNV